MNINDLGTKNNILGTTVTALEAGTISFRTAGDVVIVTSALRTTTAFITSSGTATLMTGSAAVTAGNPMDSGQSTHATALTVSKAAFVTTGNTVIFTLTVNTVSADINITSTSINTSEGIRLTGLAITPT